MNDYPYIHFVGAYPVKGIVLYLRDGNGWFSFPRMKAVYRISTADNDIISSVYYEYQNFPNGNMMVDPDFLPKREEIPGLILDDENQIPIYNNIDGSEYTAYNIIGLNEFLKFLRAYLVNEGIAENLKEPITNDVIRLADDLLELLELNEVKVRKAVKRYVKELSEKKFPTILPPGFV